MAIEEHAGESRKNATGEGALRTGLLVAIQGGGMNACFSGT
jgi:hypothetical protein